MMDMSLRLILLFVGFLIVGSIFLDGLRRLRHQRDEAQDREKREKREAAINTYAAPTVREKPQSDEILSPARVLKMEPHLGKYIVIEDSEPTVQQSEMLPLEEEQASIPQDQFFVINVVSKTREGFMGSELVPAFLSAGLRFGEMSIFHRHEQANGHGKLLFSVASLVEPGTFDLDKLDTFSSPGLSFFMCLPGPANPISAYNMMMQTAKRIAEVLGGELRDRHREPLTAHMVAEQQKHIRDWMKRYSGVLVTSD